ncbi:MAG TPA: hypothetical protein VK283_06915 [Acidimicrobiales bacterium]|nr:hypothetical protein [Acidimicrobiales bacterium]
MDRTESSSEVADTSPEACTPGFDGPATDPHVFGRRPDIDAAIVEALRRAMISDPWSPHA